MGKNYIYICMKKERIMKRGYEKPGEIIAGLHSDAGGGKHCANSHGITKSIIRAIFTSYNQQKSILRVNARVFENVSGMCLQKGRNDRWRAGRWVAGTQGQADSVLMRSWTQRPGKVQCWARRSVCFSLLPVHRSQEESELLLLSNRNLPLKIHRLTSQ